MSGVTPGLRALLGKLTAFKVDHWGSDSTAPSGVGRRPVTDLNEANVISSLLKQQDPNTHQHADVLNQGKNPWDDDWTLEPLHQIVVDVDHPVHLVESSTPGNYHLYVELPGGIPQNYYFEWLRACAKIGLVEPGYVDASIARGHSDLRLPWVSKAETPPSRPVPFCVRCRKTCIEIPEYREMVKSETDSISVSDIEIIDWVWDNEGTISKRTGRFACTDCYIKMGQPTSVRGWTPDDMGGLPVEPVEADAAWASGSDW